MLYCLAVYASHKNRMSTYCFMCVFKCSILSETNKQHKQEIREGNYIMQFCACY